MEDRFKFRVWNDKEKKFIKHFDVLCYFNEKIPHYPIGGREEHLEVSSCIYKYDKIENIMQCTGLKDKNGTLIYEGDIFEVILCGGNICINGRWAINVTVYGQVIFEDGCFCIHFKEKKEDKEGQTQYLFKFLKNPKKIIGNIHENPEYLTKTKE